MKRFITIFTCLLWVIASPEPAFTQALTFLDEVNTRGLSPFGYRLDSYIWSQKDGLPDSYLTAFLQDRDGLMWMSSKSGLFNFDGFSFRKVEVVNKNLSGAVIVRMAEDKAGNIWLVKLDDDRFTVDVFDPTTQVLRPLHAFLGKDKPIVIPVATFLKVYNLGRDIWLGNGKVIYRYDGSWQEVFRAAPGKELGDWLPAKAGFWNVTRQELRLVDARGETTGSFDLRDYGIGAVWVEQDLSFWVETVPGRPEADHYLAFNTQGTNIAVSKSRKPPRSAWHHDYIYPEIGKRSGHWLNYSIWQDSFYLGFQPAPLLFNLSRLHPSIDPASPKYFDRKGGLWTTTEDGIIRLVVRPNLPFDRFLADEKPAASTRGIAFYRDKLLVNSYRGTRLVSLANGATTALDHPGKHLGMALLAEGQDCWIASHQQPLLRIAGDGSREFFPFDQQPDQIYTILRTAGGQLLAGTDKGLFRLDKAGRRMAPAGIPEGKVGALLQDGDRLWAGTSRGLLELDEVNNVLRTAYSPGAASNFGFITHIHRNGDGLFWLATHGGGLIRWNPATGEARAFTTADGLSSDKIHAVYPDRSGHLWLPSDFGLMRFEKATGKVRTFFKQDGLADDEFNLVSHFQAPDGRLFLGGVNGITSFLPDDIPREPQGNVRLHLMEARTFNLRSGEYSRQRLPVTAGQSLRLSPSDAFLDISLSALQLDRSDLDRFAWKIEGLQDTWIEQTEPNIRLSNLPYGRHRLLVRYGRPGNQWQEEPLLIPIEVLRPFYLDWPFALVLLLVLFGLARGYTYWRTRQLCAANRQLEEEVVKRTRRIETDRALIERQAEELRSLDEMKSRFFANVTHEFRTPLTLILGPLNRLLKSPGLETEMADSLQTIQRNAARLQRLVEELLELSRMEARKLRLEEQPLTFRPFLSRLLAAFLPLAEHRGVHLEMDFRCEQNLTLLLDAGKCEKILNNLLGNALKFTPRGGSITLTVSCEKEQMLVAVEDTGQGIEAEDLPHIFDRYYQGRGSLSNLQGGTGIGLALCLEYARLFDGELHVKSTPGEGSLFTLTFPCKKTSPPGADLPLAPEKNWGEQAFAPLSNSPNPKHTVLIVEDDRDMLKFIHSCLKQDYLLLEASNGLDALRQLELHRVDLVLSDLMMPEMDGFQLLEQVKVKFADMPFVLLTARAEAQDRLQALRLGVDDYLTKPFEDEELLARLRYLIERHEIRRAVRMKFFPQVGSEEGREEETATTFDKKWLAALEAVVNARMGDDRFSVQQMAEAMNVTSRTLQYKLHAYTGLSPRQYLVEARLMKARHLLETRRYETVAEVCYAVGIKTTQYFARLMKERFGKSPTDYI